MSNQSTKKQLAIQKFHRASKTVSGTRLALPRLMAVEQLIKKEISSATSAIRNF